MPAHIEATLGAIAHLRAQHEEQATALERAVDRVTGMLARSEVVVVLTVLVALWIATNLALGAVGWPAPDPPPFVWLQATASLSALYVTLTILASQRRSDRLSGLREQLTLEISLLGEQKTAKVIDLMEEVRRDNPLLKDRPDVEAQEMAKPANPKAVAEAISLGESEPAAGDAGGANPSDPARRR